MNPTTTLVALALCGAWGSFAAARISAYPAPPEHLRQTRSRCDHCGTRLRPSELIPLLSYLLQRGRCRHCQAPIGIRTLAIEASFLLLAPLALHGASTWLPLGLWWLAWALLLQAAWIDASHTLLPDHLTLPAVALALLASVFPSATPGVREAAAGASLTAGTLVMLVGLGGWALRRGADRRERLTPIAYDTVWIAALVALLLGPSWGFVGGALHVSASALSRRVQRLPEPLLLGAWLLGVSFSVATGSLAAVTASFQAAGSWALIGGTYWWWAGSRARELSAAPEAASHASEDPEALGFGDVKLAGALGALLAPTPALMAVALAVALGALVGLALWPSGRRHLPFGPFLVAGGWLALLFAEPLTRAAKLASFL